MTCCNFITIFGFDSYSIFFIIKFNNFAEEFFAINFDSNPISYIDCIFIIVIRIVVFIIFIIAIIIVVFIFISFILFLVFIIVVHEGCERV